MTDPYKVLGVSPAADDSEIKAAYRELAKKYHPDNYANNPLSDLANEKMSEINEAYDEIMNMRRGGSSERGESSTYGGSSVSGFAQIRELIRRGNITQADSMLDATPQIDRNAEWHFLKGSVAYSRGWLNDAYNFFSTASSMDPSNKEYAAALNQMNSRRSGYMNGGSSQHYDPGNGAGCICPICGPCGVCDICNALICTDCCCECMGGDCITCC